MPKRSCVFTEQLQRDFPFLKRTKLSAARVDCQVCGSQFSVAHGGRSDVNDHLRSAKHQQAHFDKLLQMESIGSASTFLEVNNAENSHQSVASQTTNSNYLEEKAETLKEQQLKLLQDIADSQKKIAENQQQITSVLNGILQCLQQKQSIDQIIT